MEWLARGVLTAYESRMCKCSEIHGVGEVKREDKWGDRLPGFPGCQESKLGNPPCTLLDYFSTEM